MEYTYISSFINDEFEFEGAHCFSNNDRAFLLSKNGTSIVLSRTLIDSLVQKKPLESLMFKLYQRGFGKVYKNERFELKQSTIKPTLFMIDFTTKCNCNCIYCLRHFEDVGESITLDNLTQITNYIIDYCLKYDIREVSFQPWGGEPLIEIDKIIYCKKLFDEAGINAHFNIQTNGLLLTVANYKKLIENNISVGVSIDGIDAVHDAHRLDVKGEKTHKKIVRNLKEIQSEFPDFDLGSLSVNSLYSIDNIEQNISFLIEELGFQNIKFNLVHPSGSEEFDEKILIKNENIYTFVEKVLCSVIKQIEKNNKCNEANISDKLLNILDRSSNNICNSFGCRGGYSFISFDRDGNIFPCEMIGRSDFSLGNVKDNPDLIDAIEKAKDNNLYYKERCLDSCENCPYLVFCGGGCKASCLSYGKSCFDIDEIECKINKVLYPKLIELILEKPELITKILDNRVEIIK